MTFIKIQEPAPKKMHMDKTFAFWRLGFRPFYWSAALFACFSMLAWVAHLLGWAVVSPKIDLFWHAHEMVFGFSLAVVIGFLYTAARNWTGLDTPTQGKLMLIVLWWLAGRLAMLLLPPVFAMLIDASFLPIAIWPLAQVLIQGRSKRNYGLLGILIGLALLNVFFHLSHLFQWSFVSPLLFVHAAILLIVMIASIIAGRIIPSFTGNAIPTAKPVVKMWQETWGLWLMLLGGGLWLFDAPAWLVAPACLAAAGIQLLRWWGWRPLATLRNPLLWILHVSYLWVPIGFALMLITQTGYVSKSVVLHTFTVGVIAGLMMAMMTRTALGHTGRMLKAGRLEVVMYACIVSAALSRIGAGLLPASVYSILIIISLSAWLVGFGLYLWRYTPYLMRPRIDGKQG